MLVAACALGFFLSAALAVLLVVTARFHLSATSDPTVGAQKLHTVPTPRIGGLGLCLALWAGAALLSPDIFPVELVFLACAMPVFLLGLAEDLTGALPVAFRFAATICAGVLFSMVTGFAVTSVGLPGVDAVLATTLGAALFTAFAMAGIVNAVNIIDGCNGLASGTMILMSLSVALVAWRVGDMPLAGTAMLLASVLLGFLIVNFPFGRLFLGDGGAYLAGFLVGAMCVALPARNADLSPWLSLLILAYPVTETLLSALRRMLVRGGRPGQPDRRHMHSLVYRRFGRRVGEQLQDGRLGNAAAGGLMWVWPMLTFLWAALGPLTTAWAVSGLALFAAAYLIAYFRIIRHWRQRRAGAFSAVPAE
ncbi:MraY family glycosyltransferase [Oceanomicrobium pacificus]|uniref:Glycosyl transferase family 4 n=1 Tax=Oceanomicrobium pacificus TaxID=2692916 RepID=A0A6B0TKW8_9RHOB|nr:glycosyltransferase [Oceanomicrobium pacificus]MXU65137.1 glycosyl transferase family 4 [Oceanomicrobium pacificus]